MMPKCFPWVIRKIKQEVLRLLKLKLRTEDFWITSESQVHKFSLRILKSAKQLIDDLIWLQSFRTKRQKLLRKLRKKRILMMRRKQRRKIQKRSRTQKTFDIEAEFQIQLKSISKNWLDFTKRKRKPSKNTTKCQPNTTRTKKRRCISTSFWKETTILLLKECLLEDQTCGRKNSQVSQRFSILNGLLLVVRLCLKSSQFMDNDSLWTISKTMIKLQQKTTCTETFLITVKDKS